jgi:hypothetical protein
MIEPAQKKTRESVPSDEALLVAFLSDRDVVCPLCSYNLRGLTHPRCPECGQELRLTVGAVDVYLLAWIAAVAALCAAAGVGIIFVFILMATRFYVPPFPSMWENISFYVPIVSIPGCLAVIFFRRSFLRIPRYRQWGISIAIIAVLAAALVLGIVYA